jgi:hypothetical protein
MKASRVAGSELSFNYSEIAALVVMKAENLLLVIMDFV